MTKRNPDFLPQKVMFTLSPGVIVVLSFVGDLVPSIIDPGQGAHLPVPLK
jgi:hypothetical protein